MIRYKRFIQVAALFFTLICWELAAAQEAPLAEAARLYSLVLKLQQEGKISEAIAPAKRVYQLCLSALGGEHDDTLKSLGTLALLLEKQGDYAASGKYDEYVLKTRIKTRGELHVDTAEAYNNRGVRLTNQGNYVEAHKSLTQAIKIYTQLLGEENASTVLPIISLGALLENQGNYEAARVRQEQALRILRKVHGEDHPHTAIALSNLGILRQKQGELAGARLLMEQALKVRRKILGDEHTDTAASLNNLALLLEEQGDFDAALTHCESALKIWKLRLGNEHPHTATCLGNIGLLYARKEDYAAARPYYEQSLNICRKVLGEEHFGTARSTNNLGILLLEQKDYKAAQPLLEQALKIWEKLFGKDHPNTATTLNNLGSLFQAQEEYRVARSYHERALGIYQKVLGKEHPSTTRSLTNLARIDAVHGDWLACSGRLDEVRRGVRRHLGRTLPSLTEREQLVFLRQNDVNYLHIALTLGLLRQGDTELAARSAGWLLNGKGVAQAALAERALLARDAQDPKSAKLVTQLLDVRRRLAQLSLTTPATGQEAQHRQQVDAISDEESALARQVAQVTARPAVVESWMELTDMQKALPKGTLFIDIARFRPHDFKGYKPEWQPARYVAWIIPPANVGKVQIVDLGEAEPIDEYIEQIRQSIANASDQEGVLRKQGEQEATKLLQAQLAKLADQIWKPLAQHTGSAKKLLLSPDAALWLVPWGALPTGNEDEFLIEQFEISYLVSGRDVLSAARNPGKQMPPAIFANPDFDLPPAEVQQRITAVLKTQPPKADETITRSLAPSNKSLLPKVLPLPGTAQEAKSITPQLQSYTGSTPQLYTEQYALESVVKAVHSPRVAVFSTHGFFLTDQSAKLDSSISSTDSRSVALTAEGKPLENPLLRCGLLLAGCNARGAGQGTAGDDGVLTGLEIVGLDLRRTELVVLSACETGVGKIQNGEGVAGLRQAFQLAGAKSVVATLWQIPDLQSARLMNDFFINLAAGESKNVALRNAQLQLIKSRRDRVGAAHPFFWAAFTLTGE